MRKPKLKIRAYSKVANKIIIKGKIAKIKVKDGWTIIDSKNIKKISKFKWYSYKKHHTCYVYSNEQHIGSYRLRFLHRFLINAPKDFIVDHINGNGLDNRECNLRLCNASENARARHNKESGTTSKYKGVHWSKQDKAWISAISYENKRYHIGLFKRELHAAIAYNVIAKFMFKHFAVLNKL